MNVGEIGYFVNNWLLGNNKFRGIFWSVQKYKYLESKNESKNVTSNSGGIKTVRNRQR